MSEAFSGKKWLSEFRAKQLQEFLQKGFPTRRDELWKYTEIKESLLPKNPGVRVLCPESFLYPELFFCHPERSEGSLHYDEKILRCAQDDMRSAQDDKRHAQDDKRHARDGKSSIALVFVNGHFAENASNIELLPKEIICCSINQALQFHEDRIKPYLLREFDGIRSPFAKLNSATMTDGLFLDIPKNIQLQTPIYLLFINTAQNEFVTNPRNIILADKQSQVTIIEEHVADKAERYFTNTVTEIHAAENARVNYYKIQNDDLTATHVANIFIDQQKDSSVKTFSFSKGALLAREDLNVWQNASGTESELHGLYVLKQDQQHRDHHVQVDHLAVQGKSSMVYKGILDKKSRAVFNGKVHVHHATKQINAHQENHNLLLSNEAEVNTKPELEIYAEDVKCTHGATIGQLDHESLFYLMSRGIEKNEAHHILIHAFAEEIYDKIEDETIRDYIRQRMNHYEN